MKYIHVLHFSCLFLGVPESPILETIFLFCSVEGLEDP